MDNNPTHHQCIVCIGSNYHKRENLAFARQKLSELFSTICFAPEQETKPLYLKNQTLFSNQVAVFFSEEREEEIIKILKEIEHAAGRQPGDKEEEKVCLDIDLLLYDNRILKPEDWEREYVQRSLSTLHFPLCIK